MPSRVVNRLTQAQACSHSHSHAYNPWLPQPSRCITILTCPYMIPMVDGGDLAPLACLPEAPESGGKSLRQSMQEVVQGFLHPQ